MFKILDWDSNFFGIKIACMESYGVSEEIFVNKIKHLREIGVQLVYCYCDEQSELYAKKLGELVDRKVTYYKKQLDCNYGKSVDITEYDKDIPNDKLYNLSIQSGVHSRFNIDKNLPFGKFEELYKTWIRKSIQHQLAFKVLVAKEDNEIVGMVTLGEKNGRGDIGLIAVDSAFRGRGIANSLMAVAEKEFMKSFNSAQVVTQKDNIPACKLYEKCGYEIESVKNIYHIWL